eukprot:GHVO01038546.1.p1 GENE.GHVO01038546.1~~GHVO01038546.1.p1  ORF type:complete len:406 (+),score=118.01 GHVO01038546.1:49-1266(+)
MTGKVIIVTGANSGLGYEVARYLCEGGNDVILACRNEEKANKAIEKIKRTNPNALATYMQLDLASLESVRKFVDDFHETGKKLHVLMNNAGIMFNPKDIKKQYTSDNFEMTMGTNYLGPFLLTNLLLDDLKATGGDGGDSRIVMVSSGVHDPEASKGKNLQPFDFENFFLFNDDKYNGLQAYKNSKAATIMFTYELAKKLEDTGVKINAVCPGNVPSTDLIRNSSGARKFVARFVYHGFLRFTKMTRTIAQGAAAISALATDEKFKEFNGKFVKEGAEAKSSEETMDEEKQKKLWELSGGYCQMEGFEAIEVPPPPKEEEKVEEEKKEEAAAEGEEKAAEEEGEKKEGEEDKDEKKEEEVKEETKEEEVKKEETKEEVKEEVKEELKEEKKEEEPVVEKTEEKAE